MGSVGSSIFGDGQEEPKDMIFLSLLQAIMSTNASFGLCPSMKFVAFTALFPVLCVHVDS